MAAKQKQLDLLPPPPFKPLPDFKDHNPDRWKRPPIKNLMFSFRQLLPFYRDRLEYTLKYPEKLRLNPNDPDLEQKAAALCQNMMQQFIEGQHILYLLSADRESLHPDIERPPPNPTVARLLTSYNQRRGNR